ncbi:MAG: acyl-ACP, partial [Trebouxia sp. A1-2]
LDREVISAEAPQDEFVNRKTFPAPAAGVLQDNATLFVEEHRIRAYEVGADQKTTISTIANLLQEVAGNHGVALWGRTEEGFATDPVMVAMHLIFAATRIQIEMTKYPKWGDVVRIETYFSADGRIAARREWFIKDALTGELLGRATSTWVMINLQTRKVAKIPEAMRQKLARFAPNPLRDAFDKSEHKLKLPNLELPAEIEGPVQVARRSDVDMNGHINNVTYLAWALETVPREVYYNYELEQMEIDYKAECHSGDAIECLGSSIKEDTNGTGIRRYIHMLQRCDDGLCRELVRARTTWRLTS